MSTTTYKNWYEEFYDWVNDDTFYGTEDFITMNNSIGLIKVDPQSLKTRVSTRFTFGSPNLEGNDNLQGHYKLYERLNPSPIRHKSERYLYNKLTKSMFGLDDTNKGIYSMWENLTQNLKEDPGILTTENVFDYVKFFFNNVAGRHGRFEIVETYDDVKNRISNFYLLNDGVLKERDVNEDEINIPKFKTAILNLFDAYDKPHIIRENNKFMIDNVYMVFKRSLFRATVFVGLILNDNSDKNNPYQYGFLSLSNERLGNVDHSQDAPEFHFNVSAAKNDDETNEESGENDSFEEEIPPLDTLVFQNVNSKWQINHSAI